VAENKGSDVLAIIAAALAGAVVGATIAVLLTPKSGEEMRRELKESLEDLTGKLREVGASLKKKVEELVEKAKKAAGEGEEGPSPEEAQG
jgi:gas vesicle protein